MHIYWIIHFIYIQTIFIYHKSEKKYKTNSVYQKSGDNGCSCEYYSAFRILILLFPSLYDIYLDLIILWSLT